MGRQVYLQLLSSRDLEKTLNRDWEGATREPWSKKQEQEPQRQIWRRAKAFYGKADQEMQASRREQARTGLSQAKKGTASW